MGPLVKFELESGGSVIVEVDDPIRLGEKRVSRQGFVESAKQKFGEAIDVLRPVADALVTRFRGIANMPDEMELEFGIKLTAEAGAVIARTQSEGSFVVTLKWKSERTGS